MLNYQEACAIFNKHWNIENNYLKMAISKTVEYPFGWFFFFNTTASKEEQEKIGLFDYVFSGIYPSLVDKNTGALESFSIMNHLFIATE